MAARGQAILVERVDVEAIYRRRRMLSSHSRLYEPRSFEIQLHSYILPIMQGYCQVTQFSIPADPIAVDEDSVVDYIIISRRSRHRPGLRYQRRGIDDAAHVANFVETETIMRVDVSLGLLCHIFNFFLMTLFSLLFSEH